MKEPDLCKLIHVFVISRVTYSFPYYHLRKGDVEKLNSLVRQTYVCSGPSQVRKHRKTTAFGYRKHSGGINRRTPHGPRRLSRTKAGLQILSRLGRRTNYTLNNRVFLPVATRAHLTIKPLPKNMLAGIHDERRKARAGKLAQTFQDRQNVVYVDAARQARDRYS